MPGKFLRQNGLRGGSVYDLTHDRGVAIKAEQGEQALLEGISAGQAADGRVVMLTLAARVDDQGFADAAEFFQHGVDAERLALARQGEALSINSMLEELGGIRETLVIYPRRQGQHHNPTVSCLTRRNALHQRLFSLLGLDRYAPVVS